MPVDVEVVPGFSSELNSFEEACETMINTSGYTFRPPIVATWDGTDTRLYATFEKDAVADAVPAGGMIRQLTPAYRKYKADVLMRMAREDKKARKNKRR